MKCVDRFPQDLLDLVGHRLVEIPLNARMMIRRSHQFLESRLLPGWDRTFDPEVKNWPNKHFAAIPPHSTKPGTSSEVCVRINRFVDSGIPDGPIRHAIIADGTLREKQAWSDIAVCAGRCTQDRGLATAVGTNQSSHGKLEGNGRTMKGPHFLQSNTKKIFPVVLPSDLFQ